MKIKICENYYAHVCDALLGVQGESGTRVAEVEHPVVDGAASYVLRFAAGTVDDNGETHTACFDMPISDGKCPIDAAALVRAGLFQMQWIAGNGSSIIAKSQVFSVAVAPSLEDAGAVPTYESIVSKLDEFNEYVRVVVAEQGKLQELMDSYGVYPGISSDDGNGLEQRENGLFVSAQSVEVDDTLTKSGCAADAKAVGDKLDASMQEVVDARTADGWNDRTYSSLRERLKAEFANKISQGTFEETMAEMSTKIAALQTAVSGLESDMGDVKTALESIVEVSE